MRLRHLLTIFLALAASFLPLVACHSQVDATADKRPPQEEPPPPPSGAVLLLIGVENGRNGQVALLRIQNIGDAPVAYRACGAEEPRWTRQELLGGEWKDVAASDCATPPRPANLLAHEGIKFRVLLRSTSAPTRIGVELANKAGGGSTVLWSETVAPD